MKKIFIFSVIAFLFCQSLLAQTKKITPEDAAYLNRALYPKHMNQLQWLGNSDNYVFTEDNNLMVKKAGKANKSVLLSLDEINGFMSKQGYDSVQHLPRFNWLENQTAWFFMNGTLYFLDLKAKSIEKKAVLPAEAEHIQVAFPSFKVAYTIDNNLFIADGENQIQLTDNPENVLAGQPVHRNEFGIAQSSFWSADNSKLAYYWMDQRMVTDYPLVDIDKRIATLRNEKYPMAGMTSHHVKLMVYDLEKKSFTEMQTGEPTDQYLTAITWNPNSKGVFIGVLNRGQNHLKFNEYDAENGQFLKTLFEEKDDQYVEPQEPAFFIPNKPDQFLWLSQRDGWLHFYLYNTQGKMLKQLTQGEWVVTQFNGFDQKGENIFYTSTEVSPIERHFYALNLSSGQKTKITSVQGTHNVTFSKSGKYFIDLYSNIETPLNILLLNQKGKEIEPIFSAENPLKDYQLGEMSLLTLKADDGSDLYARMIKPVGFDENKKYPVIVYVYGGPHSQLVSNSWLGGANIYLNYLAQEGFIVFTLDNHGTSYRGADFEQAIHRQCGKYEMADQMKGIEYLKSLPYVDSERIGVDGWSYGGFMTTTLKLNHPEVFKVATAGGPVIDWKFYEIMYGERYMDTPQENPDGYEQSSLLNQADKLQGKLMIIHCTTDPVVVWQNSLSFVQSCIEAGVMLDYFVYPGHDHNVYGKDRAHLIRKITNYYKENL